MFGIYGEIEHSSKPLFHYFKVVRSLLSSPAQRFRLYNFGSRIFPLQMIYYRVQMLEWNRH